MNKEMKRFDADVKKDPAMLAEFKTAVKDTKTLISFANKKGYKFTFKDLAALNGELSEKDLDKVAGGAAAGVPYLTFVVDGGTTFMIEGTYVTQGSNFVG